MNSSTTWKLSERLSVPGTRVVFITDVSEEGLPSVSAAPVPGMKAHRLSPGIFAYTNGSTLIVWPPERLANEVPRPKAGKTLIPVVIDSTVVTGVDPFMILGVDLFAQWRDTYQTGESLLHVRATVGIQNTDFRVAAENRMTSGASVTLTYLCGSAVGSLKASAAGAWLMNPKPQQVVLRDSLGRTQALSLPSPVPFVTFGNRTFHLRVEDPKKIVFTEAIHG